jgi:hypothetical protein
MVAAVEGFKKFFYSTTNSFPEKAGISSVTCPSVTGQEASSS